MRRGLVAALLPAALFLPAVGLLTVCPPRYGVAAMQVIGAAFLFTEVWATCKLFLTLERRFDWINGLAVLGLLVAVLVLAATAWGFIAPIRARSRGI